MPLPLFLNVTGLGSAPVSISEGVGLPVAVTVKLPAVPTRNDTLFALVIEINAGAVTVRFVEPLMAPDAAEIVVLPVSTPVASPASLPIIATAVFVELQVTELVRFCVLLSL